MELQCAVFALVSFECLPLALFMSILGYINRWLHSMKPTKSLNRFRKCDYCLVINWWCFKYFCLVLSAIITEFKTYPKNTDFQGDHTHNISLQMIAASLDKITFLTVYRLLVYNEAKQMAYIGFEYIISWLKGLETTPSGPSYFTVVCTGYVNLPLAHTFYRHALYTPALSNSDLVMIL